MALRGKKPEVVEKRFKALFFGPPAVGKTTAAIQFPKPYLVDTEKGAENKQYVEALSKAGGLYWFTNDPDDLIREVTTLLSEKHPYRTLVIDPLTIIYNDLLDRSAVSLATKEDPTGTSFSRHKGPADRKIKHLLALLTRLDMNIIITAHSKTKWEKAGGDKIIDVGQTFDCYSKLEYLFDVVFEVQKRGADRVGIVKKTRLEEFPDGEVFPFSYVEIARRYGRETLERDAVPVQLASAEQIAALKELLADRVNKDELLEKWLTKAQSETLEEMPSETINKCIDYLRGGAANKAA